MARLLAGRRNGTGDHGGDGRRDPGRGASQSCLRNPIRGGFYHEENITSTKTGANQRAPRSGGTGDREGKLRLAKSGTGGPRAHKRASLPPCAAKRTCVRGVNEGVTRYCSARWSTRPQAQLPCIVCSDWRRLECAERRLTRACLWHSAYTGGHCHVDSIFMSISKYSKEKGYVI